ncbi:MAG: Ribosomal protein binding domain, partial [Gemmatimonadota bacterium]
MKTHGKKYRAAAARVAPETQYAPKAALELVKKEAGIEKGSGQPNRNKVGSISQAQVRK